MKFKDEFINTCHNTTIDDSVIQKYKCMLKWLFIVGLE